MSASGKFSSTTTRLRPARKPVPVTLYRSLGGSREYVASTARSSASSSTQTARISRI